MGRPASDVDDYFEWQQRLESFQGSNLDLNVFCLQEGVSRSTCYRWKDRIGENVTKIPEYVPSTLEVHEYARGKYACRYCKDGVRSEELALPGYQAGRAACCGVVHNTGRREESRNKAAAEKSRRRRRALDQKRIR